MPSGLTAGITNLQPLTVQISKHRTPALSHVETVTGPVTHDALAANVKMKNPEHYWCVTHDVQLEKLIIPDTSVELYCHTSARKRRPYVPSPLCQVFGSLHSLIHPRIKAAFKPVSQRFVWQPSKKNAVLGPELANPANSPRLLATLSHHLAKFPLPAARFLHIHIELVGPQSSSAGFK